MIEPTPEVQRAWDDNSWENWQSAARSAEHTLELVERETGPIGRLTLVLMNQSSLFHGQLSWSNGQLDYLEVANKVEGERGEIQTYPRAA